jgi:hypothetical protein
LYREWQSNSLMFKSPNCWKSNGLSSFAITRGCPGILRQTCHHHTKWPALKKGLF